MVTHGMTKSQKVWLLKLLVAENNSSPGTLSVVYDRPPARVMRSLETLGYCRGIMGTFWQITGAGKQAAEAIA